MKTTHRKLWRFCSILLLLFPAVILSWPVSGTLGRYAWTESAGTLTLSLIDLYTLSDISKISYQLTDLSSSGVSGSSITLTAEDDFLLPDTITVTIDGIVYNLSSATSQNTNGITYDASTGTVTIPPGLFPSTSTEVIIAAEAIKKAETPDNTFQSEGTDQTDPTATPEPQNTPDVTPEPQNTPAAATEPQNTPDNGTSGLILPALNTVENSQTPIPSDVP